MTTNIILIGMPGVGKSTIGRVLSKKLNKQFIDLDKIIIKSYGMDISSIFLNYGEDLFREREVSKLKNVLLTKNNFVLSLGGGTLNSDINKTLLKNHNAIFVYLKADFYNLCKRLINSKINKRPLLDNTQLETDIIELYNLRCKDYEEFANIIIDTSNLSQTNVLLSVLNELNKNEVGKI